MNKKLKLIGISAVATSGKDLFFSISKKILAKNGYSAFRLAFADEVKKDLDSFLIEKVGISAWTTNPKEKETIRPFVVSYSTHLMRKINPNIWVDKLNHFIHELINNIEITPRDKDVFFLSDVRFVNEVNFLHDIYNGECIHIKKYNISPTEGLKLYTPPVNNEEAINDPLVQEKSDIKIEWENIGGKYEDLIDNEYLNSIVLETLNKSKYFINNQLNQ